MQLGGLAGVSALTAAMQASGKDGSGKDAVVASRRT
jgi:hypothetical protein